MVLLFNTLLASGQHYAGRNSGSNTGVGIQAGYWIPVGRLAHNLNPAPSFEIKGSFGPRTGEEPNAEVFLNLFLPTSPPFNFTVGDTTVLTQTTVGFSLGLRWVDEMTLPKGVVFDFVTASFGIGATDIAVEYTNEDDENESFGGFTLQVGSTFLKRIADRRGIGFSIYYNFLPQGATAKNVGRGFGTGSLYAGLEYRF